MSHDVSNFQTDVIERSRSIPVVVDFWAEWCGPCKVLGPVLERLARRNGNKWVLAKVDTERFPEIAQQYGIRSIPNVKLFIDGAAVDEFVGALPEEMVAQWLRKALRKKKDPTVEAARDRLFKLNLSEAQTLLEPLVASDPTAVGPRVLLSKAVFFSDPERSAQLVSGVEPGDEEHELADAISVLQHLRKRLKEGTLPEGSQKQTYADAIAQFLAGEYDQALERFITVIREDRHYDDDGARRACIAIFKFLGEEHAVTLGRRREFNSSLFR